MFSDKITIGSKCLTQPVSCGFGDSFVSCWVNNDNEIILCVNKNNEIIHNKCIVNDVSDDTILFRIQLLDNGKFLLMTSQDTRSVDYIINSTWVVEDILFNDHVVIGYTDDMNMYTFEQVNKTVNLDGECIIDYAYECPEMIHTATGNTVLYWLDSEDSLHIYCNDYTLTIDNFNVKYLVGCSVDKVDGTFVIAGLVDRSTLRMEFFSITDDKTVNFVCSRFYKSQELAECSEITLYSLTTKGFMLVASDTTDSIVMCQRFTHLGSWLYPLVTVDNNYSWNPTVASNDSECMITYLNDDTVVASFIKIDNIPELDNLHISDIY